MLYAMMRLIMCGLKQCYMYAHSWNVEKIFNAYHSSHSLSITINFI